MGFNPPVPQQDSDWEIRVAVLVSLQLQILLIFVGPVRKRSSHPFPRFLVWSCYLLADWVADLALGLLLNNMGNIGGGSSSSSSSSSSSFNRRGGGATASSNSSGGGSPIIFSFWTPFLLLHLGGPDTITAYSLEDNELWLRHLIGLLFELFSALVIFGCSIRGNPMIPATVLVFVTGIIKYGERTFSLYSGSVDGFRDKILDDPDPGPNYAKLMTEFDTKKKAGLVVKIDIANGAATDAQEEAEREKTEQLLLRSHKSVEARAYDFFKTFRRLFVNLILSFKERRMSQAFFLYQTEELQPSTAFEVIQVELNFIYDMVYTKAPVAHSRCGWLLRLFCSGCLLASLVIFFFLDKSRHGIIGADVAITYALLLGGLALDAIALLMLLFSNRATVELETSGWKVLRQLGRLTNKIKCWRTRRWSGKTSQLNLINYCLREPDRKNMGKLTKCCLPLLMMFAGTGKCKCKSETADDLVFIRRVPVINDDGTRSFAKFIRRVTLSRPNKEEAKSLLLDFIFGGLKEAANGLTEKGEIMELCDCRGSRVIKSKKQDIIKKLKAKAKAKEEDKGKDITNQQTNKDDDEESRFKLILLDSVTLKDFDESVLLWHIATDLCRFHKNPGEEANRRDTCAEAQEKKQIAETNKEPTEKKQIAEAQEKKQIAETLSEYMLYLLIKQPEMLSATAGIGLLRYRDTCAEAKRFFLSMAAYNHGHEDARQLLLDVNTSKKPTEIKGDRSKSVLFDAVILAKLLKELDEELMWTVITGVWQEMLTFAAGKCRGSEHVRQLSRGGELITLVWFLMAHMGLGDMYQIQAGDAKAKLIVIDQ